MNSGWSIGRAPRGFPDKLLPVALNLEERAPSLPFRQETDCQMHHFSGQRMERRWHLWFVL
jgi:hypothetical protein